MMRSCVLPVPGCLLPAVVCVLLLSGCQSGSQGSWSWNPFKKDTAEQPSAKAVAAKKSPKEKDKLAPGFADEMTRAQGLEKTGKYDEARDVYQRLIVRHPDRFEPYHRLAVVADRQKRFREAEGLFTEAIRLEPRNPDLFNDMGYCLFLQGKLDKAEASIRKSVGLQPSNPRYRNNLGIVYGHQGRYEEALEQFRYAGSEADAFYNLAFVKASRNDIEGAEECFRRALAADPSFEPARRALANFRKAEQDPMSQFDNNPVVENGTYWVPYVEGGESNGSTMQTASANMPSGDSTSPIVRPMRTTAQSPLQRARADAAARIQQGYSE